MPRLVACVCLLFLAVPSREMVVQTSSPEQEARTRHRKAIEARARELGISLEHDEAPKPKMVKRRTSTQGQPMRNMSKARFSS